MQKIIIPNPKQDSLLAQLGSLYRGFQEVNLSQDLELDLSSINFFYPFLTLPLTAIINNFNNKFTINNSEEIKTYLDIIKFPKGIDSTFEFDSHLQQFKNYIPISVLRKEGGKEREELEYSFLTLVHKILGEISGVRSAIYLPITELLTNIFEHSQEDEGYLLGQYYPKKNYLDICITDTGRGLKQAYFDDKNLKVSDIEALAEVMRGNSTKPSKERGYGVRTSKKIVCQALNGEFIILSGSAALYSNKNEEKIINLPNFNWSGVIIAYRIPKPNQPIDISPYLE